MGGCNLLRKRATKGLKQARCHASMAARQFARIVRNCCSLDGVDEMQDRAPPVLQPGMPEQTFIPDCKHVRDSDMPRICYHSARTNAQKQRRRTHKSKESSKQTRQASKKASKQENNTGNGNRSKAETKQGAQQQQMKGTVLSTNQSKRKGKHNNTTQ